MTETFGQHLKSLRCAFELSQTELADLAECDSTYIGLLERDARTPSRQTVMALAGVFELNTSQTDRLLYSAGLAPQVDYQTLWEAKYGPAEDRKKWCPSCQQTLPVAHFPKDRCQGDGLNAQCRRCKAEIVARYRTQRILSGQERRAS